MSAAKEVVLTGVSHFYGEILGVHNINLRIPQGITSLVGSNGAGKTTLLNLITGLLRPTAGTVRVHGHAPTDTEAFNRIIGYSTQFDSFPRGLSGNHYLYHRFRMYGSSRREAIGKTSELLEKVGLSDKGPERISTYSKGMRQRLHLAEALAHDPQVLVLDEPLNGLDPIARAQFIDLFASLASEGRHVILSSHILHEVDQISSHVVMLNHGNIVAEGAIHAVRHEIRDQPASLLIICDRPRELAGRSFGEPQVVEARVSGEAGAVVIRTRDVDGFFTWLNRAVVEADIRIDQVSLTDGDTGSVYNYLTGEMA